MIRKLDVHKKNIAKTYLAFYLLYIILVTFSKFTSYYPYLHPIYETTVVMSIILNLMFVILFNMSKSKLDVIGCIFAFLIMISLIYGFIANAQIITFPLAAIYLFIINLRNINLHIFVKSDLKIKCYLLITILLLYLFHLCPSISYHVSYRNGLPRLSMGFAIYAMFSSFVFCIILSYILYLGRKSYRIPYLLVFLVISLIMFYLTDTRGILISELMIIILLFIGRIKIIRTIIKCLSIPFVILMSIIALVIPLNISVTSPSFIYWNKLFSNRLVLQQLVVKYYPIKTFGYGTLDTKMLTMFNENEKVYVDNTYLLLLLVCGIIGFLVFEILLIRSCYISIHYDNYILCIMIVSLSTLFITEIFFNNVNIYVPIICAYILSMFNRNNKEINKEKI